MEVGLLFFWVGVPLCVCVMFLGLIFWFLLIYFWNCFFWGGDYGVFNVIIRSPYSLSGECICRLLSDSRQCICQLKHCTGINMAY